VFFAKEELLPMFLQRHMLFGSCVLFYLLNLMAIYKPVNFLDSNHTGFSPCMTFFSSSCILSWLIVGHLCWKGQF
jgi:hypothetical protein